MFKNNPALLELRGKILDEKKEDFVLFTKSPLSDQIKEYGEDYRNLCADYKKYDLCREHLDQLIQIVESNTGPNNWIMFDEEYDYTSFPSPLNERKQKQLDQHILRVTNDYEKTVFRCAIGAEAAFEEWVVKNRLKGSDLNANSIYARQDYDIQGKLIDVKSTVSIGQREEPSVKRGGDWEDEIIVGVKSKTKKFGETIKHAIMGIYDPHVYGVAGRHLKIFTKDNQYMNACYFSSLDMYFGVRKSNKPKCNQEVFNYIIDFKPTHLASVIENYSIDRLVFLDGISKKVPSSLIEIYNVLKELDEVGKLYLSAHFIADFLFSSVLEKNVVDTTFLRLYLYPISRAGICQKYYLDELVSVSEALKSFSCKHCGEDSSNISVESRNERQTIVAKCSKFPNLSTTLYAHCWKNHISLVYGNPAVRVCDNPGCGCLTHTIDKFSSSGSHRGELRIGKISCKKYGKEAVEGKQDPW